MEEKRPVPVQVLHAIERDDREALQAMGRKGGRNSAKARRQKKDQEEILAQIAAEKRVERLSATDEFEQMACERNDHLLPEN